VLLPNGKVLVVGGFNGPVGSAADLASAAIYDPCVDTWAPAGTMGDERAGASLALLRDGRVLAEGGKRRRLVGRDGGAL
jgi:hypothetical protein